MQNRFRIPEMVLGALFSAPLWLLVWGWADSYAPTEKQKQECYEAAQKTGQKSDECKTFWERTTSDPVALFTLVLAISTGGLWVATIGLYIGGNRQFKLARDEFNSTHRPQIRIKHVWLISDGALRDDAPIVVRVVCVNHGTTDAVIIDYGIEYLVVKQGSPFPPDKKIKPVEIPGGFRLPSGISLPLPDFSATIAKDDGYGIRQAMANLHCMGYVHYLDGVGRLRTTAFCRMLKINTTLMTAYFGIAGEPDYEYDD